LIFGYNRHKAIFYINKFLHSLKMNFFILIMMRVSHTVHPLYNDVPDIKNSDHVINGPCLICKTKCKNKDLYTFQYRNWCIYKINLCEICYSDTLLTIDIHIDRYEQKTEELEKLCKHCYYRAVNELLYLYDDETNDHKNDGYPELPKLDRFYICDNCEENIKNYIKHPEPAKDLKNHYEMVGKLWIYEKKLFERFRIWYRNELEPYVSDKDYDSDSDSDSDSYSEPYYPEYSSDNDFGYDYNYDYDSGYYDSD